MISISLHTPATSWPFIITTVAYALNESVSTLDIRITQAKRNGNLPADHPELPGWVNFIHIASWLLKATLLVLNWKGGLLVLFLGFVLKVLPVLETVGNILMAPFKADVGLMSLLDGSRPSDRAVGYLEAFGPKFGQNIRERFAAE